ncbi:L-aspartate oxidase [Rathayibacter soli]|uniref:L-aspartate oxidase n=1 Tax=Rathayibacter soli TaxID=3144168 RepID=UPI0027E4DF2E|nr:L-aspartate oxidase [Glaciibacter superstes]
MPSVIVVGSGIAGLSAALRLSATHSVTLITKATLCDSNTRFAQGGIAAVLSAGLGAPVDGGERARESDSTEAHILDTLRAGAGLSDYAAAEALCTGAADGIRDLIASGVHFDRQGGNLARGLEAAHTHARVLHAGGDATGAAIEKSLVDVVRASTVAVAENAFLTDLEVDAGHVVGVQLRCGDATERAFADTVILATGGAGQLYRHTTNPEAATGDGIAAAWRAGATLADVEFYQFHPTALAVPGNFLVSEAVRGEGAVLLNAAGDRFMRGVHPDAELAPRDVVARSIAAEMATQGGRPVLLDATALGRSFLAERFPTIDAATRAAGFDWAHEPVPVTPAAHYWMGGIATDLNGRTSLPGLYAVGEAACTGVHGANRLASNSLLEGLVFAARAAKDIGGRGLDTVASAPYPSRRPPFGKLRDWASSGHRSTNEVVDRSAMQQLMWDAAGVLRSGDSLERAAVTLSAWRGVDPASATIEQLEDANLLELARILVHSACERTESRGAHARSDFPRTSAEFERHLTWTREDALRC